MARSKTGAVIDDVDAAVAQAISIAARGEAATSNGTLRIRADTICVHGDRPDAATFARRLREAIEAAGLSVAPLTRGRRA